MSIFTKIRYRISDTYSLVRDKIKFTWENIVFKLKAKSNFKDIDLKDKIRNTFDSIKLKAKYSNFLSKLFSKLNNKTLIILASTYIFFVIIQLILFRGLWKAPDVTDVPKVKNYLSSYIFKI